MCDHQCRFIHCYAGNVGSVHDQRVFRLSELNEYLSDATKFHNNSHLIGDAAYTLHENLLVPYRDNGHLTQKQKNSIFVILLQEWQSSVHLDYLKDVFEVS